MVELVRAETTRLKSRGLEHKMGSRDRGHKSGAKLRAVATWQRCCFWLEER